MNWYYAKNGRQIGPIEIVDLKDLYTTGQLFPTDLVWNPTMPQWLAASKIPAIISTSPATDDPTPAAGSVAQQASEQSLHYYVPAQPPPIPIPPKNRITPSYNLSNASFTLGILSLFGFCLAPVLGLIGIVIGIVALNNISAYPYKYRGKKTAIAGILICLIGAVLGIIETRVVMNSIEWLPVTADHGP